MGTKAVEVTKMILRDFVRESEIRNPLTGKPLSKQKRMDTMYGYVTNSIWQAPISLENRILASKLITAILEENDNLDLKKSLEKLPLNQEMDEFK